MYQKIENPDETICRKSILNNTSLISENLDNLIGILRPDINGFIDVYLFEKLMIENGLSELE